MENNKSTKKIVANYGELSLKGKNHDDFVKILRVNITHLLSDISCKVNPFFDHLEIVDFDDDALGEINYRLRRFIGISNFYTCLCFSLQADFNFVAHYIAGLLRNATSYKLEVSRKWKKFRYTSTEIKKLLAGLIRKETNLKTIKVDVNNPDVTIFVRITTNGIEVFDKKILGINGLPVASSGKVLMLLSGGIDSPVASHLLAVRGFRVDFLTFVTPPYTSEKIVNKLAVLINRLTLNGRLSLNPRLFVCDFSDVLNELTHIKKDNYRIIIMRRCFLRMAELLAQKYHYDALATGDACGQVASQTIESLKVINEAIAPTSIVLRPLIAMNKAWIIDYARKIGTYDISILPFNDSCTVFAPKNPITKPKLEVVKQIEADNVLINDLCSLSLKNKVRKINGDELVKYEIGSLYTNSQ